jgi:hypothetical protein
LKRLLFLLLFIFLIGCTDLEDAQKEPELKITGIISSFSTLTENSKKSIFDFEVTIKNTSDDKLEISTVEPYILQNVADLMDEKELIVDVNRGFSPSDTFEISNYIVLKTVKEGEAFHSQNDIIVGVMVTFKNGEELFIQNKNGQ